MSPDELAGSVVKESAPVIAVHAIAVNAPSAPRPSRGMNPIAVRILAPVHLLVQAGFLLRELAVKPFVAAVAAGLVIGLTPALAHAADVRFSFDLENAPLFSRSATTRTDMAGFSSFTARSHMRIGQRMTLSGGLGLSPISTLTLLTFLAGEPTVLPDPIINLQVPVTLTYFFQGVGRKGLYAFGGARFMIVPVIPCVTSGVQCPNGRDGAFGLGPAAEAGLGYQLDRGAAWRISLSYMHAKLAPLGNTGETRAFEGMYHGVVLSFGGITDKL